MKLLILIDFNVIKVNGKSNKLSKLVPFEKKIMLNIIVKEGAVGAASCNSSCSTKIMQLH
jgi:hypothetical protein